MDSVLLSYDKTISTLSSPDGTVTLNPPVRFNTNTQKLWIRLNITTMSSRIPNVYNYGGINNGLLKVSRDNAATWTSIQLPEGVYTMPMIEAAVNTTLEALNWWADASDPGILIRYNLATEMSYISIDSSKLAAGGTQLCIDLRVSDFNLLLGFVETCYFDTDGVYGADKQAQMNWFGDSVQIELDGFGALTRHNGVRSNIIADIPLSTTNVTNEYVYPFAGIISPMILLTEIPRELASYTLKFYGSREDTAGIRRSLLILEGRVAVTLELFWR